MKQLLENKGWTCRKCSCPGKKGYDCANKDFKGVVISIRSIGRVTEKFRIIKNSLVVDNGFGYELESKMIINELA